MFESYLEILEEAYFEIKVAFEGLSDAHVWQSPAAELLLVGQIAGHMAYWEAVKFAGDGGPDPDLAKSRIESPLVDPRFGYYPMEIPPSPEHLAMSAEQVCGELLRVHREVISQFRAQGPTLESHPTGWPPKYTYRAFLTYAPIHVAYHVGQIYSVRHLLGDRTPDN